MTSHGQSIDSLTAGELVDLLYKNGPITIVRGGETTHIEYVGEYPYAEDWEGGLAGAGSVEAGPGAGPSAD